MPNREKVIKGIDICLQRFRCGEDCPYYDGCGIGCMEQLREDAIALLKEQENEEERILKIVWDILHGCVSTDTEEDQDYVYELIRNKVHPIY